VVSFSLQVAFCLFFAYALFSLFTPVARTLAGGQGQRQRVIAKVVKLLWPGEGVNESEEQVLLIGETADWHLQLSVWL